MNESIEDKNCASYWLPKLMDLEIPMPETIMLDMKNLDSNFSKIFRKFFLRKDLTKKEQKLLSKFSHVIRTGADKIGFPCFIRTGHTSHKHNWSKTCYIENPGVLLKNVQNIGEYNMMANMEKGLPVNIWLIREFLEVNYAFKAFDGMPVGKEFRYFIDKGKIICRHPYWPKQSLKGFVESNNWKLKLEGLNTLDEDDKKILNKYALKIGKEFKGYWSVDFLQDKKHQWYLIDMAKGEDSFHWKDCHNE